jgi:hypothetical protein
VRDRNRSQLAETNSEEKSPNVPIAVLTHLIETCIQHDRLSVRRATTHVLSVLLSKSSDSRRMIFDISNKNNMISSKPLLLEWMDATINAFSNTLHGDNETNDVHGIRLLQRETYLLFQNLDSMGYSHWYPTLPVTIQRFQQFCPDAIEIESFDDYYVKSTEAERRRIRDEAMDLFLEMDQKISKLITRAHHYMDILVPRIGVEDPASKLTESNDDKGNKADDDNSVEWEDGWENEQTNEETTEISHLDAVENTLALIEASGRLREGQLEIDFSRNAVSIPLNDTQSGNDQTQFLLTARNRLLKLIQNLTDRYLPRLSSWVDALSKTDGLVLISNGGSTALMRMNADQKRRRQDALDCMKNKRDAVLAVLQATNRLGAITISDIKPLHNGTTSRSTVPARLISKQEHGSTMKRTNQASNMSTSLQRKLNRPNRKIQIRLLK